MESLTNKDKHLTEVFYTIEVICKFDTQDCYPHVIKDDQQGRAVGGDQINKGAVRC